MTLREKLEAAQGNPREQQRLLVEAILKITDKLDADTGVTAVDFKESVNG